MNFIIWRKNNVSFSRYLDFRLCYIKLHLCLFLLNPKYYQNDIWLNTSVLYDKDFACFHQCGRLETSSRPFYHFIKMTIQRDLAIFYSWHLPFSIVPYSSFQKNETLRSWHNWLLRNWSKFLNWKGPGT